MSQEAASGARPQNLPSVSGGAAPCDGPRGPDLGSAPRRMRSNQGPRSLRLTCESLGTRWLRVAAPPGGRQGPPEPGEGSTWEEKVRVACGPWRQAHPPSTGPLPLHGCALALGMAAGFGVARKQFQSSTPCSQARPSWA